MSTLNNIISAEPIKQPLITAVSLVLVLSQTACNSWVVMSSVPRATGQNVTAEQTAELVQGNSEFAFDLYHALSRQEGDLFFSPQSISTALAMTYAGARGETETQMAETLHFTLPQEQLHPAFNSLDIELAKRGKGRDEGFNLEVVNAIWGQKDYTFSPAFLDTLAENYGAGVRITDFEKEPEMSRITVNDWVNGQTRGRIKDLLPPDAIDSLTRLVLTNTIYFNARWLHPFPLEATVEGQFHMLDNTNVSVKMMHKFGSPFGYTKEEGYQAVELPYEGNETSMVIIMPEADQFHTFEESLRPELIKTIIKNLHSGEILLAMPRFEFASDFRLKETLSELGMPLAFSGDADFSAITGNRRLWIRNVWHKASVSVTEEGTEASAATAGVAIAGMDDVRIDHPFIFLIRDIKTGAIIFVGRVMNPVGD